MISRIPRIALLASFVASSLIACAPAPTAPGTSTDLSQMRAQVAAATTSFGTAGNFAVLAATAVTCTNGTILGNVGEAPGTAYTNTSCPVTGNVNLNDPAANQAQTDFQLAYTAMGAMPCTQTLTTLDGQTLAPGVYCFDAAVTSTGGVLTLNGPATGTWIFKVGTLGTGALTGTNFSVVTPNGTPPACNSVYWWTAEAATLTDSTFVGTILSGTAITLTRGTFNGDAFAKTAVTITGDAVTGCNIGSVLPPVTCSGKDKEHGTCRCQDGEHHDSNDSKDSQNSSDGHTQAHQSKDGHGQDHQASCVDEPKKDDSSDHHQDNGQNSGS
jgi:hypothetical protein